jgi:hypothetical protein
MAVPVLEAHKLYARIFGKAALSKVEIAEYAVGHAILALMFYCQDVGGSFDKSLSFAKRRMDYLCDSENSASSTSASSATSGGTSTPG